MKLLHKRKHLDQSKTAYAKASAIRVSPQKLSLVADLIKGMPVSKALLQLDFCRKSVSRSVSDVLKSAISNAENNHGLDIDSLYVSEILIGKGLAMKRLHARAKGNASRITKLFSNMTIFVTERRG